MLLFEDHKPDQLSVVKLQVLDHLTKAYRVILLQALLDYLEQSDPEDTEQTLKVRLVGVVLVQDQVAVQVLQESRDALLKDNKLVEMSCSKPQIDAHSYLSG